MELLIPSETSTATIFLILSSPHACICLTSYGDHFDTRQVVRSVSDFEFVILLGHGQSPILSNQPLDKLRRHSETSCLLWNVQDNAIFPSPVRRAGCGGLLLSTDCVRWWRWCTLLCATAAFDSTFSRHGGKHWRIFGKASFLPFFFGWRGSQDEEVTVESGGNFWVGTSKIILDLYHVICLVRWIMRRIGKVGREVVKKLDYQW